LRPEIKQNEFETKKILHERILHNGNEKNRVATGKQVMRNKEANFLGWILRLCTAGIDDMILKIFSPKNWRILFKVLLVLQKFGQIIVFF
jgi:hypothetical protein